MNDYKEKIRKLLALAQSPNENEAKLALLKAQKLMVEHHLTLKEFEGKKELTIIDRYSREIYSQRSYSWAGHLAKIIGDNFRCEAFYQNPIYKSPKRQMGFIGSAEDVEIAIASFDFAFSFVREQADKIKKAWKGYGRRAQTEADSYAVGFINGLKSAFDQQIKEHKEYGLMVIKPHEIQSYKAQNMSLQKSRTKGTRYDEGSYNYTQGYNDGKSFTFSKGYLNG